MLRVYVTVVLIWGLQGQLRAYPAENTEQKIGDMFEKKCLKNADANAFEELINDNGVSTCVMGNIMSLKGASEENIVEITCTQYRDGMYKCLQVLLEKLEPCLDAEEKYLPEFLQHAYNVSFDRGCADDGSSMRDMISKLQQEECDIPLISLARVLLSSCSRKLKLLQTLGKTDYVIRKADLCSDIETIKSCLANGTKEYCGKNTSYTDLSDLVFDPYLVSCNTEQLHKN